MVPHPRRTKYDISPFVAYVGSLEPSIMTDTNVRKVGDNLADDLGGETEYSCELVEFASSNCFPLVIYESRSGVVGCAVFCSTVRSEGGVETPIEHNVRNSTRIRRVVFYAHRGPLGHGHPMSARWFARV